MKRVKVLVTCGPTWVPIDDVRVISNISSGLMGHAIAEEFLANGCSVTVLEGPVTHFWNDPRATIIKYSYFDDLAAALRKVLKQDFDVIIHAAAVSDYKVVNPSKIKLDSSKARTLKLSPTLKLIDLIRTLSPASVLVGFKLGSSLSQAVTEAKAMLDRGTCDVVVANVTGQHYRARILNRRGRVVAQGRDKYVVSQQIVRLVQDHVNFMDG